MRYYLRKDIDIAGGIERCRFDAEQGKVSLALDRAKDLADEFPDHPDLVYAEGLLRVEFLGQGLKARSLFQRAHHLAPPISRIGYFAACNACAYSRDWNERREWAERALKTGQRDPSTQQALRRCLEMSDPGKKLNDVIQFELEHIPESAFGIRAARMEMALSAEPMAVVLEIKLRRHRAQTLRQLDAAAETFRSRLWEIFPPEERLALLEAVTELEKALGLDQWDPELWNLRSAWFIKLDRFDEALSDAEKAIELRPHHYHKPFINKAHALEGLERYEQARACAREAIEKAGQDGAVDDERLARSCLEFMERNPGGVNQNLLEQVIDAIPKAANLITAPQEMARYGVFKSSNMFFIMDLVRRRTKTVGSEWNLAYIRILAELLSDYTSETVFLVILYLSQQEPQVGNNAVWASLCIAANSDGVRRRDAARFYLLNLFGQTGTAERRRLYRNCVLAWAAAARNMGGQAPKVATAFSQLDSLMYDELRRVHPELPEYLAEQDPIRFDEESIARLQLGALFQGEVPQRLPAEVPTLAGLFRPIIGIFIVCWFVMLEKPFLFITLTLILPLILLFWWML